MMKMVRRIIRLRRNEDGSPTVEFVFAAPVLVLMSIGTIEFGLVNFVTVLMESGLRDAARFGITGQEPDPSARLAAIVGIIEDRTIGLVDIDAASIEIVSYENFTDVERSEDYVDGNANGSFDPGETYTDENGNGQWDADVGVAGAGESGQVVVYRMEYNWPLLTPVLSEFIGDDGYFPIRASIAVRNEPWETGA
ncbi:MAG: pilus assembly protein [Rhodobacteraceae bacterium]|jgi:hypothetical protein|nr:pilus assembly protein [Paracoccaceae bacterium]